MKQRILLALMSALLCLSSCEDFQMPGTGSDFTLDKTEFTVPAEGGKVEVTFIPVTSWSAQCADPSVIISPASGEASTAEITLSISVGKNTNSEARVIKVLLSIADKDYVLAITQAAKASEPDVPGPGPDPGPDPTPDPVEDTQGSTEGIVPGEDIKPETK